MANIRLRKQLRSALMHPTSILGDGWEFMSCWISSRKWSSIIFLAFPAFALSVTFIVLFIIGTVESPDLTVGRYVSMAQKVSDRNAKLKVTSPDQDPSKTDPAEVDESEKAEDSEFLYYRRILQLKKDNQPARFYVALHYDRKGARPRARKMMQDLAPLNGTGYEKAHEWLAYDAIQQKNAGIEIDEKKLVHHLNVVANWKDAPAALLLAFAQYTFAKKEDDFQSKTLELIKKASKDKVYLIACSSLVKQLGNSELSDVMSEEAVRYFGGKIKDDPKSEADRLSLASAFALKKDWQSAKKVLGEGIKIATSSKLDPSKFQRGFSDICLEQYRLSKVDEPNNFRADLGFLDQAIEVDPWNPKIGEEIALLMQNEASVKEDFKQALQKQMSDGRASHLTYLIVGSFAVRKGVERKEKKYFDQGAEYLALAYKHGPNWPLAINNYAMVLTMIDPPQLQKALEIINRGVQIDPYNTELRDSRGRILLLMNDLDGAIASFDKALEYAIKFGTDREDTRRALVETWEKKGNTDMVEVHRKALLDLQERMRAKAEKN